MLLHRRLSHRYISQSSRMRSTARVRSLGMTLEHGSRVHAAHRHKSAVGRTTCEHDNTDTHEPVSQLFLAKSRQFFKDDDILHGMCDVSTHSTIAAAGQQTLEIASRHILASMLQCTLAWGTFRANRRTTWPLIMVFTGAIAHLHQRPAILSQVWGPLLQTNG